MKEKKREGNKGLKMTKCVHGKKVTDMHTHTHRNESSKNTRVIISAVFEVLDYNHLILICCLLLREEEKKRGKERQREERDGGKLGDKGGIRKRRGKGRKGKRTAE